MTLEKKPFINYLLDEEKNPADITFTVRITPSDKAWFEAGKIAIKQPKASTALKQLAQIGAIVLQDPKQSKILDVLFGNLRRNERLGIPESEIEVIKK